MMTGVERPMKSAFQTKFSPLTDQVEMRPVSVELPFWLGPRQFGQSAARRGEAQRSTRRKKERIRFDAASFMGRISYLFLFCLEKISHLQAAVLYGEMIFNLVRDRALST
jgi:hypothetical protein